MSSRTATGSNRTVVLLDGYNVIKRHPAWSRLPLADARQRLVQSTLSARWPFPVHQVTIVFDGPSDDLARPSDRVLIRFATPSADAFIRDTLHRTESPQRYVLISSDGELQRTAKSHGTRWFGAGWFLERIVAPTNPRPQQSSRRSRSVPHEPVKPDLPAAAVRRITEELMRRWLGTDD